MNNVAIVNPANNDQSAAAICPQITHGTADKTHAVMIIEIPLPIPFSVITSPNHIKAIVQAVIIVIAVNTVCVLDKSIIVPEAKVLSKTIIQYD
jgi:hypothetical protein